MLGILCSGRKEKMYVKRIYELYSEDDEKKNIEIAIFTIEKTNIKDKLFHGTIITNEGIKSASAALPSVILNFAVEKKKESKKRLRRLSELEGIEVINWTNKFNQATIMEMLYSNNKMSPYILPMNKMVEATDSEIKQDFKNIIIMPKCGSCVSKILYFTTNAIRDNDIKATFSEKYWIILKTPKILMYKNSLPIIRCYVQKNKTSDWEFIASIIKLKDKSIYEEAVNNLDNISLMMIKHINNFIPDLGYCFFDFIIDSQGKPYFIHLGGWDRYMLKNSESNIIFQRILGNFISLDESFTCVNLEG